MTWPIAHRAFVAYVESLTPVDGPPPAVTVLGIDETRRGKGRYEVPTDTGVRVWIDRFDTGLVACQRLRRPIRAGQRAQLQVGDRVDLAAERAVAGRDHARRDRHVRDLPKVVREALPHALVILDRFHLVALANRAVTDYRRELAWTNCGRRGRKVDPEWARAQPAAARRRNPDQGGVGEDAPGHEDR